MEEFVKGMEFEEFVNKAKMLVIEKRITNKNVKAIWLKDIYKIGYHLEYLKELEKMPIQGLNWNNKLIEHHKQQTLKD
jgi:hypothetical protein